MFMKFNLNINKTACKSFVKVMYVYIMKTHPLISYQKIFHLILLNNTILKSNNVNNNNVSKSMQGRIIQYLFLVIICVIHVLTVCLTVMGKQENKYYI